MEPCLHLQAMQILGKEKRPEPWRLLAKAELGLGLLGARQAWLSWFFLAPFLKAAVTR